MGEALLIGCHLRGRKAREFDHLADAPFVEGFGDLLGRVEFVREPADLVVAERVVDLLGAAVALGAQVLDVGRHVLIEGIPQLLEAILPAFFRLDAAEFVEIHYLVFAASPRAMRKTPTCSGTECTP